MHVSVDLDWFVQSIVFGFVSLLVFGLLVRKTASWYFVVDSNFDSDYSLDLQNKENNSMGLVDSCVVCGLSTTKYCARCKMVKYCSGACQTSHWKSGHKGKCEGLRSSYKANHENSTSVATGRRVTTVSRNGSSKMLEPANKVLFPYEDFVELFNWDRLGSYPPCGLINCGNSCFANVVLQCLAYTRPLVAYLLEKGHHRECYSLDWCFFCEFQRHVQLVSQSVRPFSPINILSRLPNIGANFGYGKQEDAHEFMRFAIDNMQSACLDKFGGEKAVPPKFQETTLIQHIFGGRLQSQVVCTECNNVSNQFENMMDLTVEIHGDAKSLEECLDQFTAKEQLHGDNMYKCDGCNAYVKAWKRLLVQRAPNILTIALKRFQSGRFGKLNKKVSFPETLDLSPYKNESEDGNDIYKLYAVIVHIDMLNASFFGHYICYVKDFRGNWFRIDDCKVESVDLDEVLSQGAYMLLYSRICARPSCLLPRESLRKEENKNLKIQEPAVCSAFALECLDNTVDLEQPSSTSGLLREISMEDELSASISDAKVGKQDIFEPNLPVIEVVEHDQSEDLSTVATSSMDIDTNQPGAQNMELTSIVAVEDATKGSKTGASEKFTKSVEESHASESSTFEERKNMFSISASVNTHSSSMPENFRSSAAKLKPLFAPGFLGKRPQNEVKKSRDVVVSTSHLTEFVPNQTKEIQRVVISESNGLVAVKDVEELHNSSEELSTAPESITEHINRPHITNNTFLIDQITDQLDLNSVEFSSLVDVEDASQGCINYASEKLPEESHATDSCTFEEDKSTCNNFSSSVIINGEVKPANSMYGYKNANLENGSTSSSGDIQDAIKKSDMGNSAAKLKQNVCASNANLNNGLTSFHGSAVKLKPIFTPGFLGKRMRKEVIKPENEVPANFSKLAPKSGLNDQTKVR